MPYPRPNTPRGRNGVARAGVQVLPPKAGVALVPADRRRIVMRRLDSASGFPWTIRCVVAAVGCLIAFGGSVSAEVVRFQIDRRADVLDGRSFGNAGPYELLEGRIAFEFD